MSANLFNSIRQHCEDPRRGDRTVELDELHVFSRRGLWGLFIFLAASALALAARNATPVGTLSGPMREFLGAAPPLFIMDLVFAVSTLSSLLIIAGPLYSGKRPGRTWPHLGFRVVFYLLYICADSLAIRFDAIFIAGIVVLALQHYSIWKYTTRAIDAQAGPEKASIFPGVGKG